MKTLFTFQYVSINTAIGLSVLVIGSTFTFQYVSINTTGIIHSHSVFPSLHSNMFLLIRECKSSLLKCYFPLHSNMFLLILNPEEQKLIFEVPLHSNMFLLIPRLLTRSHAWKTFTFQYVSINTDDSDEYTLVEFSLHSNMFLLIRGT